MGATVVTAVAGAPAAGGPAAIKTPRFVDRLTDITSDETRGAGGVYHRIRPGVGLCRRAPPHLGGSRPVPPDLRSVRRREGQDERQGEAGLTRRRAGHVGQTEREAFSRAARDAGCRCRPARAARVEAPLNFGPGARLTDIEYYDIVTTCRATRTSSWRARSSGANCLPPGFRTPHICASPGST